jgi:uncharacterized protein
VKISVKAKPGAKVAQVKDVEGGLHVAVKEPAAGGKANRAIEKAVARHLGVAPSRVSIVSGHTSHTKVVAIT